MMQAIQSFDASVLLYIQDYLRTPVWNAFFVFFSRLGDGGILWIALGLALLFPAKTRRRGFDTLVCLAFAFLVANCILKPWVARVRPYDAVSGLTILVPRLSDWSFPPATRTRASPPPSRWRRASAKKARGPTSSPCSSPFRGSGLASTTRRTSSRAPFAALSAPGRHGKSHTSTSSPDFWPRTRKNRTDAKKPAHSARAAKQICGARFLLPKRYIS